MLNFLQELPLRASVINSLFKSQVANFQFEFNYLLLIIYYNIQFEFLIFSRILRLNSFNKLSLLTAASLLYSTSKINKSDEIFQVLNKQSLNSLVKFYLNGRIIGQGAVLKNGLVVTRPEIFEGQQTQMIAQINGQPHVYQLLKIEEGLAVSSNSTIQSTIQFNKI